MLFETLATFYCIVHTEHRMDKRKSFVFPRQYRPCFSPRINQCSASGNEPIKTAVGTVMHDFYGLNTMTFHHVADILISDFQLSNFLHSMQHLKPVLKRLKTGQIQDREHFEILGSKHSFIKVMYHLVFY